MRFGVTRPTTCPSSRGPLDGGPADFTMIQILTSAELRYILYEPTLMSYTTSIF
uniref:Uncharacterized protein n=1 Tax=Oryza sativa subsp. japonica TaxID=39947 RepID=Q6H524_ORYSJ|nr:hypothetical protein [Oryza sativa Japonica Group]